MKKVICLFLVLMLAFGAIACSADTTATAAPAASEETGSSDASSAVAETAAPAEVKEPVHLVYGAPSTATSVSIWYALQQGYFEDYGVDLEMIFFNSGTSINDAARAGEIDLYSLGCMMATTGATTFGSKLVAYLAPDNAAYRVYARNDSPVIQAGQGHIAAYPNVYGDAESWENSTVLLTKGQSGHYTISAILELLGITCNDITYIDMEQNQIPVVFSSGEGDVMVAGNPNWAEFAADPDHYTLVASLDMLYPDYDNIATIMACKDALENKTEGLYGFVKALTKAQIELEADSDLFHEWMYKWQQEYNVSATQESATFDCGFYKLPTLDFLDEYYGGGADSIVCGVFSKIAKFMSENDQMSADTYANYQAINYIAPEFTLKAVEDLRAEGYK